VHLCHAERSEASGQRIIVMLSEAKHLVFEYEEILRCAQNDGIGRENAMSKQQVLQLDGTLAELVGGQRYRPPFRASGGHKLSVVV